ncbi:MAG: DUF4417 domain-containing protein [Propionibacteriaceae bacterium]|nr:DUF4417 domain-containing protein [Propionibacteriaceae bacterium]
MAIDLLYTKHFKALIWDDGIQRIETFMFPQDACRITVVPAVGWGSDDSLSFFDAGIPRGSCIAVSTMGIRSRLSAYIDVFKVLCDHLDPAVVVAYGSRYTELEGFAPIKWFEHDRSRRKREQLQQVQDPLPEAPEENQTKLRVVA